jgi:4-hydroxybenzoyl-CoA thioesterase
LFLYERPVRFEDVDATGIVFFSRFFNYCHEAMEALLAPIDGAYAGLIMDRRLGLPAVRAEAEFKTPLRFGDTARIEVTVARVGTKSCELHYHFTRMNDGAHVATVRHVVVLCDLGTITSAPIPVDVRKVLESHLVVGRRRGSST